MKRSRKLLASLLLFVGLGTSGCLGTDNLYNSVKNWNAELSDQDWLNEVVFIGMNIIPVYPISMFVDVVVLNTVEYWTGSPLIKDPGTFPGFTSKD